MSDTATEIAEQLVQVRPLVRHFVECALTDRMPNDAAVMAFGIDSRRHLEALYFPIRAREISPLLLDSAIESGERLTALTRAAPSNPHRNSELVFETIQDQGYTMASLFKEIQADTLACLREEAEKAFTNAFGDRINSVANDNHSSHDLGR